MLWPLCLTAAEVEVQVYDAAYCANLWLTYTSYLSGSEDATQKEHLDRNGEEEDEWESQRRLCRHNSPEDSQTHQLDAGEQMHAQCTNLEETDCLLKKTPTNTEVRPDKNKRWSYVAQSFLFFQLRSSIFYDCKLNILKPEDINLSWRKLWWTF